MIYHVHNEMRQSLEDIQIFVMNMAYFIELSEKKYISLYEMK